MANVVIIDYGMGNIWSVKSAINYVGSKVDISDNPEVISKASHLILPGVGSFRKAMHNIRHLGIEDAIKSAVIKRGGRILGICLGMQLLGSQSTEDGMAQGLGLVPNKVERFNNNTKNPTLKVPHVGFNTVKFSENKGLFSNLPRNSDFYFVHSYRMLSEHVTGLIGECSYIENFLAAFEVSNVMGTQFHPEKSQTNGLQIIKNFLAA